MQNAEVEGKKLDKKALLIERQGNESTIEILMPDRKVSEDFTRMIKAEVARPEVARESNQKAADQAEKEACRLPGAEALSARD